MMTFVIGMVIGCACGWVIERGAEVERDRRRMASYRAIDRCARAMEAHRGGDVAETRMDGGVREVTHDDRVWTADCRG